VIAHCRELIAGYKVPKQVRFVDSLPLTASNKVLKRALRDEMLKTAIGALTPSEVHQG
jgi:acyl-CoA synthetase (AMP-forming)/AMP-acid ligase II